MHQDQELNPHFENGQDIRDRTFELACSVVQYCQRMFDRGGVLRVMAPQLVNCGTSTASMLEEASAAESRRDFISKCSIALKEARETRLRLRVCARIDAAARTEVQTLVNEADQIVRILSVIIRNTRRNAGLIPRVLGIIGVFGWLSALTIRN